MQENDVKIQMLVLNILKQFVDLCNRNGLTYYISGGALIGIVRHGGFIPWDDDIDVAMPRKDYDRFVELMMENPPEGYGLCNRLTNPDWHFAMSQFFDIETEVIIRLAEKPRKAHLWIDVFPIDGLPKNVVARKLRVNNILLHRYIIQLMNIDTQVDFHRKRPIYEKAILKIGKTVPFLGLLDNEKILNHLDDVLKRTDYSTAEYVGNMLGRYRSKEVVPKKFFGKPQHVQFEGVDVMVPEDTDALLTALYGDYMTLPDEKNRIAHNIEIIKSRSTIR